MRASAEGKDVLALLATGSGKTEIALVSALARRKLDKKGLSKTLMVVPLTNLQQELKERAEAVDIGTHLISENATAADIAAVFRNKSKNICTRLSCLSVEKSFQGMTLHCFDHFVFISQCFAHLKTWAVSCKSASGKICCPRSILWCLMSATLPWTGEFIVFL